jgi:hypothetical protein
MKLAVMLRIVSYTCSCLLGLLNLQTGLALVGGGHGTFWPFLASIVLCGIIALCVSAISRSDWQSLRNWLILILFLDGILIWKLLDLGKLWEIASETVIWWAVSWFLWQPLLWGLWLGQVKKGNSAENDAKDLQTSALEKE